MRGADAVEERTGREDGQAIREREEMSVASDEERPLALRERKEVVVSWVL
jgi:hypothetical protein